MSENLKLIETKLEHLARMRAYLDYSTRKMQGPLEKIRGKGKFRSCWAFMTD
jgi:hypothetical protein